MGEDNSVRHRTNHENCSTSKLETDAEAVLQKDKYFEDLRVWIQQAQLQQNMNAFFPYYMLSMQSMTNGPYLNNNYQIPNAPFYQGLPNNLYFGPNTQRNNLNFGPNAQNITGGYSYVIPPLWKRFVAEFIDFIILFFLKLAVTLIAVDLFDYIDLDKYDIENIRKNLQEDYRLAFEMTTEILILECVYRILVCIFEAVCLSIKMNGRVVGATPGKALLGLKVVSAVAIAPMSNVERETVVVSPGTDLTFWTALARSVIKNVLIALLFPLCFVLFFFQHNRTGYDIFCNVIVVEDNLVVQEFERQ